MSVPNADKPIASYSSKKAPCFMTRRRSQLSPHFFEGPNATGGWRFAATILAGRVLKRDFGAPNCRERGRAMLVGFKGPLFAPYEGQRASKSGRSRNEGIPERGDDR